MNQQITKTHKGISYTIAPNSDGQYEIIIGKAHYLGNFTSIKEASGIASAIIDSGEWWP